MALVVGICGVGAVAGCTSAVAGLPLPAPGATAERRVFDASAVEDGVRSILEENYRVDGVGEISCPEDQPVVKGYSFRCDVRINGARKTVVVTNRDTEGEYEVSLPE
ncbi:DUF4333 domain-containing protein [Actinokineospora auranticolor]|uniref:Uncharacterized protein DUF4333 n=1 Tax=Actinokineospora auranticolor TaxID=155976 RepID=A0A2S6GTF5_9PSEU|nr:DUF4333 domain-containing protein [Actinokineospora auranticolor]PPK68476.1 uncharacterized protein DUF4333 [Actinokineospora auranticolor]